MGSGSSKHQVTAEEKKRNQQVQQMLQKEKENASKSMKILLLGGPTSGKTTITKQMQIIHNQGYKSDDDAHQFRTIIHTNIVCAARQLLRGCRQLGIDMTEIQDAVNTFKEYVLTTEVGGSPSLVLDAEIGQCLERIWKSEAGQNCYANRAHVDIFESTQHYMDRLEEICSENYAPTEQDILRARMATSGIHEIQFTHKELNVKMVDVGGQKSERRKWLHVFDDVQVVMFVADISGYAKIIEDGGNLVNCLENSLEIFHDAMRKKELANAKVILFLNKIDIFSEVIGTHSLAKCFKDYEGPENLDSCQEFILNKFLAGIDRDVYYYFTTAINTDNVNFVFSACMDVVYNKSSAGAGL